MPVIRFVGVTALVLGLAVVAVVKPGGRVARAAQADEPLPVFVHARMLAEAEKPGVELAPSAAFWMPGPERFYGWALRDLRDYLRRVSGVKHPLAALEPGATRGVFAGTFEQFPDFQSRRPGGREAVASTDPEAFVVEVQGDKLFVLGKTDLGLIAGVYTLLDTLGCKWFAPGPAWEQAPDGAGLTLDGRLDAASAGPSYQARFFFPNFNVNAALDRPGEREAEYALWNLRNRMGGSAYTANTHNAPIIPESLFATRPELFALANGNRSPRELARGNPEALALATQIAVEYLKVNEGKGSFYNSFSVETADGAPADEASLAKVGNHTATDLDFWFANEVAAGLERAGLTDKWVGLLSYFDHAGVPSFDLHPRVGVTVATALDASSGMTVEQRLDGLRARKAQRLGLYDYLNVVTWSLDKPGSHNAVDPLLIAERLKRYHDHGARTYLAETADSWVNGGAGHYVAARMLWDLRGDPRAELDAYYQGAFGPAAEPVRALYEDWADLPPRVKMPPGALAGLPRIPRGRSARWHEWITTAEARVKGQPRYLARLNDLKRYYLYLNFTREFELDLADPRLGTKADRYGRLLRYVGANRGEGGALHVAGLLPTLVMAAAGAGVRLEDLGGAFQALSVNLNDEAAWRSFTPLTDAQIDAMFAAARLPLDGHAPVSSGTFDPRTDLFPAAAGPPAEVKFPKLHGPPAVSRQYLLWVVAPTPKLTFDVLASAPFGPGIDERTCVVTDALDREIKRVSFAAGQAARFELTDVAPGFYTATFFEFGAEEVTVTGGNTFGAVRAPHDTWGFNPMRRADQAGGEPVQAYFLVPAGRASLRVRLTEGTVSLAFADDGSVIAADVKGAAGSGPREFSFAASDRPRAARVTWAPDQLTTTGFIIEGVTLFGPDPGYVLHESLE